ncbi:MAG TPA: hypothetical protein V6C65_38745 [Allocoleopsis sp.]
MPPQLLAPDAIEKSEVSSENSRAISRNQRSFWMDPASFSIYELSLIGNEAIIATNAAPGLEIVAVFAGNAGTKAAIGGSLQSLLLKAPDGTSQPSKIANKML